MADPLHILNVGNTHVQLFESPDPESLIPAGIFSTPDFDPDMVRKYLPRLAAASVVPRLTEALRKAGAFVISGAVKLPFAPSPLDLTTVGADRLGSRRISYTDCTKKDIPGSIPLNHNSSFLFI